MADTKTAPAAAAAAAPAGSAAAAAAAKPAKPKAEPKPPRFAPTSTVHFLPVKGKEGFTYGPATDDEKKTVNPKRANTKSFGWFANYAEGITIEKLAEKYKASGGSMNSNLDWDTKHGFIEIRPAKA